MDSYGLSFDFATRIQFFFPIWLGFLGSFVIQGLMAI
jgi:hypothetical protein